MSDPQSILISDVLSQLQTELGPTGATVKIGHTGIAENDAPPKVVFEPIGIGPMPPDRAAAVARRGSPRVRLIQRDAHSIKVHIWGGSRAICERFRSAVLMSLRKIVRGDCFLERRATWIPEKVGTLGSKIELDIDVYLALVEVAIASPITDLVPTRETSIGLDFDGSDDVDGDGALDAETTNTT